ncbi:rhamnan synthesis F family protein [Candidatus Liberibacter asiaticus]|uniref:Rhamnan synthesis protein F n=3 Tax=Liberibacter asiaticus TaxID=34021 RepID=A0ABM5NGF7_LIBAS|nr:rhamnan synthesis F family protein [Candidatus Liberibacter asiaticus]AGH17159.1 hypothetical protein WSI_03945 [Candidatus Liberibacter asiaticus str. gxpsy]ALK07465.1 hypothetical protein CD16_04025 [Candidatus Liberibacter asiaticus]AWL14280.1 hypothetical protein DIC79_04105 [Candidatus Liberibacter asiaticus]KAE9509888.1 Rhamnan synthesis protein F [Candidatus Liberibacter asiaticus]KAE9512025.1 Rhamnan synthesis protein F [Candidatus Liberibacter asiaticus]
MIFFPTVYRLIPDLVFRNRSLCSLRMISSNKRSLVIYLPVSGCSKGYFLFTSHFKSWNFYSDHFNIEKVNLWGGFFFWFWTLFYKRSKKLCYDENYVVAYGSRSGKKFFAQSNLYMMERELHFDGQRIHHFPQLLHGWESPAMGKVMQIAIKAKIAIVVHLYYIDLWIEIANLLSNLSISFDLHVTLVTESASIKSEILKIFPAARIHIMENHGRDVLPFLILLETEQLSNYDYVCKIHGKKSKRKGYSWWEGDLWRRWLFYDLLGAPGVVFKIIRTFDTHRDIGMIGSRAYRYPNKYCDYTCSLGKNREMICTLAGRMGITFQDQKLDFFAGTMFWVRTEALDPIKNLRLSRYFEPKVHKALDGEIEHAVERCFSLSVKKANFRISDVDCILGYRKSLSQN